MGKPYEDIDEPLWVLVTRTHPDGSVTHSVADVTSHRGRRHIAHVANKVYRYGGSLLTQAVEVVD